MGPVHSLQKRRTLPIEGGGGLFSRGLYNGLPLRNRARHFSSAPMSQSCTRVKSRRYTGASVLSGAPHSGADGERRRRTCAHILLQLQTGCTFNDPDT